MSDIRDFINLTNLYTNYIVEANTRELAKKLYDAGAGKTFGTEEKDIYDILDSISAEDFSQVVNDYKDMYDGANLVTDLKNEMSGKELTTLNQKLEKLNATEFSQFAPEPETTNTNTTTPPQAQTTAPAQPQAPATDTTAQPATPRTDEPALPIDGDVAPERPVQPATDTQPAVDTTTPAQPATDTQPAVDAAAGVTPAARTRTAAPDTTDDARAARTNAPAQPNQLLSGLPAKLSQIRSANLMKDYNAGGKQPMDKVRDVQLALSRLGHDPNGIDGKYGPGTFKAVQEFQKANGLSVDGQVGPNTIRAMIDKLGRASLADISSGDSAADVAQDDAARTATTPTQQNQSKDLSMKTAMNESASMNVSMTGDNAAEVAELMKLLKNAGMPDASPVKDIMPPMAPKGDMADFMGMVDSGMQGPAEPCSVCGEVHEETSCSEGTEEYDAIIDEWDNSPEEEYKDHNYMTQDLSGGINRPKKAYAKAQDGDNAMAVEAIKSDLRKALEEALKGK